MNDKQKLAYFHNYVKELRRKLLIDPKTIITTKYVSVDELSPEEQSGGDAVSELVKHEELLVSHLERVFCGEKLYRRAVEAGFRHRRFGKLALATCHLSKAHYWIFDFEIYDRLLSINNDADFKALAYCTACHELLHVVMWPAFSYAQSLEMKREKK